MHEPDLAGMEIKPCRFGKPPFAKPSSGKPARAPRGTVEAVPDDRMADFREVYTDLVSPPGCDPHREQRIAWRLLEHPKIGLGLPAARARAHFVSLVSVAADWHLKPEPPFPVDFDLPRGGMLLCHLSVNDRPVGLLNLPLLELCRQAW